MAKSHQTFQKREREKKRLEKRQDKRERLQQRQKRNGNSLGDMIAYLDENGNIIDRAAYTSSPRYPTSGASAS